MDQRGTRDCYASLLELLTQEASRFARVDNDPVYADATTVAQTVRQMAVDELGVELPEARIVPYVQRMVEAGYLEQFVGSDGKIYVRPIPQPREVASSLPEVLQGGGRYFLVEVFAVPRGDAPEEYRQHWIGTRHLGLLVPAGVGCETGFETMEVHTPRDVYLVGAGFAFAMLEKRCAEGAAWFRERSQSPFVSFGVDEMTVVKEIPDILKTMDELMERLFMSGEELAVKIESLIASGTCSDASEAIEILLRQDVSTKGE